MTNDREMPCDIDEFFLGLRELLDACAGRLFVKTPLWQAALKLETDAFLQPVTQH
jgi:hypothetical protein